MDFKWFQMTFHSRTNLIEDVSSKKFQAIISQRISITAGIPFCLAEKKIK